MAEKKTHTEKKKWMDRFLNIVEKGGNLLPHPATLFAIFAILVVIISDIAFRLNLSVAHPATGEMIKPVSLLSISGSSVK